MAHQHPKARQSASSGQHGRGRCQGQSARTRHHQHGHRHHQGMRRVAGPPPSASQGGHDQHPGQKRFGHTVGQLRKPRLVQRRVLHQRQDLGELGVFAHVGDANQHWRQQVVTARHHLLTYTTGLWSRLAGQQGFIGQGLPVQNDAVRWKALRRQHADHVIGHQTAHGHTLERAIPQLAQHTVGQSVHQRLKGSGGLITHAQFQPTSGQQEEHKHGE